MTDTIKRLGFGYVSKKDAPGAIYTVPGATTAHVRTALVSNRTALDAWCGVYLGGSTEVLFEGMIPPFGCVPVPVDVVLSAADTILAQQIVSMEYSQLSRALLTRINQTLLATATTYASSSWQAMIDCVYTMDVFSSHATAAAEPTGFTDTHSLTWTKVQGGVSLDGKLRLTQYRAKCTSTSSTTTTVNFAANQTGCGIRIVEYTGADLTGSNGEEAVQACGILTPVAWATDPAIMNGTKWAGMRYFAFGESSLGAHTPLTGWTELTDADNAGAVNVATYSINTPGATAGVDPTTAPPLSPVAGLLSIQDPTDAITVAVSGVEVT